MPSPSSRTATLSDVFMSVNLQSPNLVTVDLQVNLTGMEKKKSTREENLYQHSG